MFGLFAATAAQTITLVIILAPPPAPAHDAAGGDPRGHWVDTLDVDGWHSDWVVPPEDPPVTPPEPPQEDAAPPASDLVCMADTAPVW